MGSYKQGLQDQIKLQKIRIIFLFVRFVGFVRFHTVNWKAKEIIFKKIQLDKRKCFKISDEITNAFECVFECFHTSGYDVWRCLTAAERCWVFVYVYNFPVMHYDLLAIMRKCRLKYPHLQQGSLFLLV